MNKQELCSFICDISGWNECNTMVLKQINKYVKERGLSYIDIARALSYYVDVMGNKLDAKYGIGIVGVIINDSRKYFEKLEQQRQQQIKAANEAKRKETKQIKYSVAKMKTIRKKQIDIEKL